MSIIKLNVIMLIVSIFSVIMLSVIAHESTVDTTLYITGYIVTASGG